LQQAIIHCVCGKKMGPLKIAGDAIDDEEADDLRSEKGEVLLRGVLALRLASLARPPRPWNAHWKADFYR